MVRQVAQPAEEDFVMAARLDGESETQIITRYMLPGFTSYIIVSDLSIPNMILGETSSASWESGCAHRRFRGE